MQEQVKTFQEVRNAAIEEYRKLCESTKVSEWRNHAMEQARSIVYKYANLVGMDIDWNEFYIMDVDFKKDKLFWLDVPVAFPDDDWLMPCPVEYRDCTRVSIQFYAGGIYECENEGYHLIEMRYDEFINMEAWKELIKELYKLNETETENE